MSKIQSIKSQLILFALLILTSSIAIYSINDNMGQRRKYKKEKHEWSVKFESYKNWVQTPANWKKLKAAHEWECFVEALTWVESRHNDHAVNKYTKATGQFQIMPVFVKEANRLQDKVVYTLDDRTNYKKSREMFEIIQARKNPTRSFREACRIHYGSYCPIYYGRVMKKYREIIKNQ